jgi:hypothetical protein
MSLKYITEKHPIHKKLIACEEFLSSQGIKIFAAHMKIEDESGVTLTIGKNPNSWSFFPRDIEEQFYIVED